MRSQREQQTSMEPATYRELQLLTEVDASPDVTQRQLSHRVGIALGLTNLLLRNLTQKGYIRVSQATWKRRLYTLTPEGFSHRVGLLLAYVQRFLDHYQKVRQTLREQLEPLALHEESRVAICGTGEFAELVYLGLREIGIEEIEIFATSNSNGRRFLGMPVHDTRTLQPEDYDRVLVAELNGAEARSNELKEQGVAPDKLVTFFANGRDREVG